MRHLSIPKLMLKRLVDDRPLLLGIFVSIIVATTLVAAAPVYVKALERLGLNLVIDRLERPFSNINALGRNLPLTWAEMERTEQDYAQAIVDHFSTIYESHERFLIVSNYLAGTPAYPLPPADEPDPNAYRAYFRHYTHMEQHVETVEGRLATGAIKTGPDGPRLEAVISQVSASMFSLRVGDEVIVAPDLTIPTKITVEIVGIVKAPNPTEDFWKPHASFFLDPPDPEEEPEGIELDYDPQMPPLPMFITLETLVDGVGAAYPGTLVDSLWFAMTDMEALKAMSIPKFRSRFNSLERDITRAMPGAGVFTGINQMMDNFEKKSFFARVPMLLLLSIMVATVLFYMAMMVSYLVQSREGDAALLRTRGVATVQLLRIHALEGAILTVVAVAVAPFTAMALIALAGKLPYFRETTGGDLLPVEIGPVPFLMAIGAGLLCLAILVVPGAFGARGGLLAHKLHTSRPPTMPFFHRYYMDIGLMVLGGLIFWELHSRGQLMSGGLFKDVDVDETMLIAPVLFLLVVALVFMRFFPLLVRLISGESPALLDLAAGATLLGLAGATVVTSAQDGDNVGWLAPVATLLSVGGAYWATRHAATSRSLTTGLVLQAGLVGVFLLLRPLESGNVLFLPSIALIGLVPAQMVYLLLRASTRVAPVWVSMGLWRMARNPLQYTWLILLLVLVTGVGILSSTVGGTLDRSQEERVLYEVATDVRIMGLPRYLASDTGALKERYLAIQGITSASPALRMQGTVGPTRVEVLAIESGEFPYISWYRKDFSSSSLGGVMRALQSHSRVARVELPEGATSIGAWVRPQDEYSEMYLYMVVEDERGRQSTISLGTLGPPEWRLMRGGIPTWLKPPLYLISVQVYEPGVGSVQRRTPGTLFLDEIHVTVGTDDEEHVVEDFEGQMRWVSIITSPLAADRIGSTVTNAFRGRRGGVFDFGEETSRGLRGFYQSPTGGPIPVVISTSLANARYLAVGDVFIPSIEELRIPVVVRDTVDFFPTMSPDFGGFILSNLDNLIGNLNILSPNFRITPNEVFLTEAPASHESVRAVVSSLVQLPTRVYHKAARLESVRLDPLTTAGWNSMALLSLGIVLLAAVFGYVIYLLRFAHRSRGEMGFLQSLGLSRRQMLGLVGFEHMAIAAIGLGLGTWAGFQMSTLMVSALAVTESGEEVLPPFVLTTDWSLMVPTYLGLLAVFLAALYVLSRSIRRVDLVAISRIEDI